MKYDMDKLSCALGIAFARLLDNTIKCEEKNWLQYEGDKENAEQIAQAYCLSADMQIFIYMSPELQEKLIRRIADGLITAYDNGHQQGYIDAIEEL